MGDNLYINPLDKRDDEDPYRYGRWGYLRAGVGVGTSPDAVGVGASPNAASEGVRIGVEVGSAIPVDPSTLDFGRYANRYANQENIHLYPWETSAALEVLVIGKTPWLRAGGGIDRLLFYSDYFQDPEGVPACLSAGAYVLYGVSPFPPFRQLSTGLRLSADLAGVYMRPYMGVVLNQDTPVGIDGGLNFGFYLPFSR